MARHFTYLFTIFLILYSGTVQSQQNQQQQQQQNRPPQQGQQQQQQQNRPPQQGQQQQQNRPPQQGQQPQQGQNVARPMSNYKIYIFINTQNSKCNVSIRLPQNGIQPSIQS